MKTTSLTITVCLILLTTVAGCANHSISKSIKMPSNPLTKNKAKTPQRMVDVWNTFAQTDPAGGKPIRGLAGRVMFFADEKNKKPVKVDGRMTVFVFDSKVTDPAHSKPLKQYVFPTATLEKHYSHKEPFGHCYDFFLPFDEVGGDEKTLCVMARFDDKIKGEFVMSQPVTTVLQGASPENATQKMIAEVQSPDNAGTGKSTALLDAYQKAAIAAANGNNKQSSTIKPSSTLSQSDSTGTVASIPMSDSYASVPPAASLPMEAANNSQQNGNVVYAGGVNAPQQLGSNVTHAAATVSNNANNVSTTFGADAVKNSTTVTYGNVNNGMYNPTSQFPTQQDPTMLFPNATVPSGANSESQQVRSAPYQFPATSAPTSQSFGFGVQSQQFP
ncbi:MAG: hypothetical protein LBU65_09255 [Planctomycetaceae bacterium]|jgi:hypothetical protein|nr:hypothetical protein [Planctomycetaceae bacterium]